MLYKIMLLTYYYSSRSMSSENNLYYAFFQAFIATLLSIKQRNAWNINIKGCLEDAAHADVQRTHVWC